MADEIIKTLWIQLGAVGLLIIGMGYLLFLMDKRTQRRLREHKSERDEWRSDMKELSKGATEAVNNNTKVLHRIEGLINGGRN